MNKSKKNGVFESTSKLLKSTFGLNKKAMVLTPVIAALVIPSIAANADGGIEGRLFTIQAHSDENAAVTANVGAPTNGSTVAPNNGQKSPVLSPGDSLVPGNSSNTQTDVPPPIEVRTPGFLSLTYNCGWNANGSVGEIKMGNAVGDLTVSNNGNVVQMIEVDTRTGSDIVSFPIANKYQNYTVEFTGNLDSLGYASTQEFLNKDGNLANTSCLKSIDDWSEDLRLEKVIAPAWNSGSFESVPNYLPTTVTDLSYMFAGLTYDNSKLTSWNTSNVQNLEGMFQGIKNFNQNLSWNLQNATDVSHMFQDAHNFARQVNFTNTGKVTDMSYMFNNARTFNASVNFDTKNVKNMSHMFAGASNFDQAINFDGSNLENASNMFAEARVFKQNINMTTPKLTDASYMFKNVQNYKGAVSLSTGNVTTMEGMFSGASQFNHNISGWDVSKVTNWSNFKANSSLSNANTPAKFL